MVYQYSWVNGSLVAGTPGLLEQLSHLYSTQHGVWGEQANRPAGTHVALSPARLRNWLPENSMVALAYQDGVLVGYAVVVRAMLRGRRMISWVTQFVVHEDHRRKGVGKKLLFSAWGFSSHFAWGIGHREPVRRARTGKGNAPPRVTQSSCFTPRHLA